MKTSFPHRLVAAALLASVSLATLAPAAQAGNGRGGPKKYRKGEYRQVDYRPRYSNGGSYGARRVVVHRSDGAGPAIAGFIGGLALGAILSNSQHDAYASPPRDYCPPSRDRYYDDDRGYCSSRDDYRDSDYGYDDPYCHERFSSLDVYLVHARRCDHPRVVRVIDSRGGDCVRVIHYDRGQWGDWHEDSDWDD